MTDKSCQQSIPPEPDQDQIRQYLSTRCHSTHIEQRLKIEQFIEDASQHEHGTLWKKLSSTRWRIDQALKLSLLGNRGKRNALALELTSNEIHIPGLPEKLNGVKILHLSDLHFESVDGLVERIVNIVKPLQPDLTFITGDIRDRTFGSVQPSLQMMFTIRQNIQSDCYAVLGNHDSIRMVPALESMKIPVLLNESINLVINKHRIAIIGVDDPSHYQCDNLPRALAAANISATKPDLTILLAHSPDRIDDASHAGMDIYLCGHTHGGQICLPGGFPVHKIASSNRRYCSGPWKKANTCGYTSRGIGTSIAPARFNCPPEITMHTLHRATDVV